MENEPTPKPEDEPKAENVTAETEPVKDNPPVTSRLMVPSTW